MFFYAWERRGRGWQVWPYPVELEPPFRPVAPEFAAAPLPPVDDGRTHTFFSAIAEKLTRRRGSHAASQEAELLSADGEIVIQEPAPEIDTDDSPPVELQVALPPGIRIAPDVMERFLFSLSYASRPVSFEVIGVSDAITVQLACRECDRGIVREQLRAHFPDAAVTEEPGLLVNAWETAEGVSVIVDFGLAHEFMRPLRTMKSLDPDPLIAVSGALGDLEEGELGALQVLFQRARAPWAAQVLDAVSDGSGGAFFADAPEMLPLARAKVARPLFAAVIRVAVRSPDDGRAWAIGRALGGAFAQFSDPASNELIPLSREDLEPEEHEASFLARFSRRSGMLLNSEELVSLVHVPSASVRAEKLRREAKRTKAAPAALRGDGLVLGENVHAGRTETVALDPGRRTRHTYVIGASGTGKSTLLLNMIIQDLEAGAGVGVLDPHGDLVDRILGYVPDERADDVVLLDPSDEAYPVGFNILSAHSELEKNILASDLVAVFRRLATSWGDQMTSVLGNAILAFLESEQGGTLADLRRFLVEKEFRRAFLKTVRDPEIVYYWEREFPLLAGKPQAPVLTRLDTFLRPKLIRYMVAQQENKVDLGAVMNERKIFLAKLSQGAIGEENAHLLGSLLVSKFQQVAMSRQELAESERRHFYLYIDEFQNFITPSLATILSGARKYGLGLILAHQDLRQLAKDPDVLAAVLTNPCTRICFRVGDADAKKLEEGFTAFRGQDLQTLGVGDAVCRVERADWDFNLRTLPLPEIAGDATERRETIIARSHERYGTPKEEVEARLRDARPEAAEPEPAAREMPRRPPHTAVPAEMVQGPATARSQPRAPAAPPETASIGSLESPKSPLPTMLGRGGPQHQYLQELVKRWAESRGYRAVIEQPILDGLGSVDVALEKGGWRLACEISVSSTPEQELGNVHKCVAAGFDHVAVVSTEKKTLTKAAAIVAASLGEAECARVRFFTPEELFAYLETQEAQSESSEETVKGYKVKVQYRAVSDKEKDTRRQAISQVILKALKRLKGKGE
jgi:hypothetical protein